MGKIIEKAHFVGQLRYVRPRVSFVCNRSHEIGRAVTRVIIRWKIWIGNIREKEKQAVGLCAFRGANALHEAL